MIDNNIFCNNLIFYNLWSRKTIITQKKKNPKGFNGVQCPFVFFSKYFTNKTAVGIMIAHEKANN